MTKNRALKALFFVIFSGIILDKLRYDFKSSYGFDFDMII